MGPSRSQQSQTQLLYETACHARGASLCGGFGGHDAFREAESMVLVTDELKLNELYDAVDVPLLPFSGFEAVVGVVSVVEGHVLNFWVAGRRGQDALGAEAVADGAASSVPDLRARGFAALQLAARLAAARPATRCHLD